MNPDQSRGVKLTVVAVLAFILLIVGGFVYRIQQPRVMTATEMKVNGLYLLGAVVLGIGFLYWAIVLIRGTNPNAPMETFKYSIIYLMALFVVMLLDHYLFPIQPV